MLDTNVVIDAVCFSGSFGRRAYELTLRSNKAMMSRPTFAELQSVLIRPKFARYLSGEERRAALAAIALDVCWAEPWCHYQVCRDPSDDHFLDLAVCSGSSTIVTRDDDLLKLHPFNGIAITTPRDLVSTHVAPAIQ